jgi:hypothetical protein
MEPGSPFMALGATAPSTPVTIFPLQIEKILLAIVLFFKELIKLLNGHALKHTN